MKHDDQTLGALAYFDKRVENSRLLKKAVSPVWTENKSAALNIKSLNDNAASSYDEISKMTSVSKQQLSRLVSKGKFPAHSFVAKNGKKYWKNKALKEFLSNNEI